MSAVFILRYGGMGVRFSGGVAALVGDKEAERFTAESDAWHAAYKHNLNPDWCMVTPPAETKQEVA